MNNPDNVFGDIITRPQEPIFKRTPANTIEPQTGASTCALGSQIWTKYIGVFTIKAAVIIKNKRDLLLTDSEYIKTGSLIIYNNKGSLVIIVYNNKYCPAINFSGW